MKNSKLLLLKYFLILSLSTFLVAFFVQAWQAPTANPPQEDLDEILTTSDQPQSKLGDLNIGPGLKYWITKLGDSFALKNDAGEIKFVVGQDGKVGIGTTSPNYTLDVKGNVRLGDPSGASFVEIADINKAEWRIATGGYDLSFQNDYDDDGSYDTRVIITETGKVGIGTTNPGARLHILSSARDQILVEGSSQNGTGILFRNTYPDNNNEYFGIEWGGIAPSRAGKFIFWYAGTDTCYDSAIMTLTKSGNVGIGTTNPNYKLDVQGQINASGGLCINGDCKSSWDEVGGGKPTTCTIRYSPQTCHVTQTKYVYCESDEVLYSCGYKLTYWDEDHNSPDALYPVYSGGKMGCAVKGTGSWSCFKAVALCCK